jgi:hypothetical protein
LRDDGFALGRRNEVLIVLVVLVVFPAFVGFVLPVLARLALALCLSILIEIFFVLIGRRVVPIPEESVCATRSS